MTMRGWERGARRGKRGGQRRRQDKKKGHTEEDLLPIFPLPLCCSSEEHVRTNNLHQLPRRFLDRLGERVEYQ
jgi:hypothetical protein